MNLRRQTRVIFCFRITATEANRPEKRDKGWKCIYDAEPSSSAFINHSRGLALRDFDLERKCNVEQKDN